MRGCPRVLGRRFWCTVRRYDDTAPIGAVADDVIEALQVLVEIASRDHRGNCVDCCHHHSRSHEPGCRVADAAQLAAEADRHLDVCRRMGRA